MVRLAPRGLTPTILTHELTHAEIHARLGIGGQVARRLPRWMDEGIAVIVSDDPRYLGPGAGGQRCLRAPRADLPATPGRWVALAARERDIYAEAACATLLWQAENGGWAGVRGRLGAGAPLP